MPSPLRARVLSFEMPVIDEPLTLRRTHQQEDFLLQELNREANTTLSKSTDLVIKEAGLAIKAEVEKLREQVQNVE